RYRYQDQRALERSAGLSGGLTFAAGLPGKARQGPSRPPPFPGIRGAGRRSGVPSGRARQRPAIGILNVTRSDLRERAMEKTLVGMLSAAAMLSMAGISMAEAKTLGIVALLANDALNIDVIGGATKAANAAGWDVKVIDTQASA